MAIQFVGGRIQAQPGANSGSTNIFLNLLTGGISSTAVAGDLVVAVYSTGSTVDQTLTITGTGAYTTIASELYSNGTSYDTNLLVAYRFITTDTSTSFGASGSAADAAALGVFVWRGVDTTTPLDVAATTATGTGTGRPTPPAITPTTSGAEIVAVGASAAATGAVFTTATLSNFFTVTSPDTNDANLGFGSFDWVSGTYTPAQFGGGTTNAVDSWAALTLALRPATTPTASSAPMFLVFS